MTGLTGQNAGLLSHLTIKYDGQTGAVLWGPIVLGGVLSAGTACVDSRGNVFVSVARQANNVGAPRFTTLEYDSLSGMFDWGPVAIDGDEHQYPTASAVSAAGDLYVEGAMGSDFGVMKFRSWTGTVVLTARAMLSRARRWRSLC